MADSLWGVWSDPGQSDTNRLKAIDDYAWIGYINTKPDSAFYYAQLQYDFALTKGLKSQTADALTTQGISMDIKGNYTQAIAYHTKSLKIREEIGDKKAVAGSLGNIGNIYLGQGDYTNALDCMTRSLKIQEEIALGLPNDFTIKKDIANSFSNIGLVYSRQGYYTQALTFHTKSLTIREEIGDKQGVAGTLNNTGIVYAQQGDYAQAVSCYTKSLALCEELGDRRGVTNALNNIGNFYSSQGNYAHAIAYFMKSLRFNEEIDNQKGIAGSLINLGNSYKDLGNYVEAFNYYKKSLTIFEEIGDKKSIASSLNNLGNINTRLGNYTQGIDCYAQSLTIREEIGDKRGMATSFVNIGLVYTDQRDYVQAIDHFIKSLAICEELGDKTGIAICAKDMGIVYSYQGDYSNALIYGGLALATAHEVGSHEVAKEATRSLLTTNLLIGDITTARHHLSKLRASLEFSIQTNFFTLSETEKQTYFQTMESDFGLYYDFALHYGKDFSGLTDTAYNIALRNKGLTLKSSTAIRQSIQSSGDSVLIAEYETWLQLRKKIAKINDADSISKVWQTQANKMEQQLIKKSNFFNDFDKVNSLKWQDVQATLQSNEAAIEFVHFNSEIDTTHPIIYAALLIKKDSEHPQMIQLCTEAELGEILGAFQGNNLSFVKSVYGTQTKAEKGLYQKIWQPLEEHLEGVQSVYYAPTGLLHKISFAALCKDNNVFLCDAYQLHELNSSGKMALTDDVNYNSDDQFLLMGGVQYNSENSEKEVWSYLPGTQNETEQIHSFLQKKKHNSHYYTLNDASENNFKTQAQNAQVLHISTHGFFFPDPEQLREEMRLNDQSENENELKFRGTTSYANWNFVNNKNPLMRSGIVLAGANDIWQRDPLSEDEDGVLTAQEVSNLDLKNTKLVVLSACETGLGDIKGSEGVFGLQRAFKMAGVKYLIMSLWQVPDKETAEFMQLFYKNLLKLKDIPAAFQKTQKTMRAKYDPYYWGAFVLIE